MIASAEPRGDPVLALHDGGRAAPLGRRGWGASLLRGGRDGGGVERFSGIFRAALVLGLMARIVRYYGRHVKQVVRYMDAPGRSTRPTARRGAPYAASA